jgi:hypothetical protein
MEFNYGGPVISLEKQSDVPHLNLPSKDGESITARDRLASLQSQAGQNLRQKLQEPNIHSEDVLAEHEKDFASSFFNFD